MAHETKTCPYCKSVTPLTAFYCEHCGVVLRGSIKDQTLRNDLVDLALIEERKSEPERPLRDFLDGGK